MKLEDKEINDLKKYQQEYNKLIYLFGDIELKIQSLNEDKKILVEELKRIRSDEKTILDNFHKKYGEGSVDLEKGEFIKFN
jgi:hypothetical protein